EFRLNKAVTLRRTIRSSQANKREHIPTMSETLTKSSNLTSLGSDAAEVVTTRSEWETLMRNDSQLFETTRFGEPRNLAIQISDNGKVGSIVYEVPDISLVEGKSIESLDRFAMTMRKEGDAWRIVQG